MGNIVKDTQQNLMPPKKIMERTKEGNNSSFGDNYEVRQLSTDFNRASLESKIENLAYIRSKMQNIVQDINLSGIYVIRDVSHISNTSENAY